MQFLDASFKILHWQVTLRVRAPRCIVKELRGAVLPPLKYGLGLSEGQVILQGAAEQQFTGHLSVILQKSGSEKEAGLSCSSGHFW